MEGIDWSGEQNEGKWMAAIDGRNMNARAAIHGRNGDTGREAGKDEAEGTKERPKTATTGTRRLETAKDGRDGDMRREAAIFGRFHDGETGGWGYWRSLRASRSMSATGWQLSLRSMLWPVSGV